MKMFYIWSDENVLYLDLAGTHAKVRCILDFHTSVHLTEYFTLNFKNRRKIHICSTSEQRTWHLFKSKYHLQKTQNRHDLEYSLYNTPK